MSRHEPFKLVVPQHLLEKVNKSYVRFKASYPEIKVSLPRFCILSLAIAVEDDLLKFPRFGGE